MTEDIVSDPHDGQTFTAGVVNRLRCIHCGTQQRHHHADGTCPQMYRPDTLDGAIKELDLAMAHGDDTAVFVARGNVQRLGGNPDA